jgi:hypothetical protein
MQADRDGLEHIALVELSHRHPPERLARPVLLSAALLPIHDRQLVGLADLLEHPQDPPGSTRVLSMKDVHDARTISEALGILMAGGEDEILPDGRCVR